MNTTDEIQELKKRLRHLEARVAIQDYFLSQAFIAGLSGKEDAHELLSRFQANFVDKFADPNLEQFKAVADEAAARLYSVVRDGIGVINNSRSDN